MKNILTVLIVVLVPLAVYFTLSKNPGELTAVAQDNSKPSMITFTSTMCSDCKKLKEVLKTVQPEYASKVNFTNINALDRDKSVQEKIKKYNVTLVPTMVFTDSSGKVKNVIEGYIPEEQLVAELEGLINE